MKSKFTIGELSKLFNISTTALRYYDEIDLFKPEYINKENNYRYYTVEQFEYLNTIIYLKNLGVSLREIKDAINNANIQGLIDLFENQKQLTEQKLKELSSISKKLENRINNLNDSLNFELLEQIREVDFDDRLVIIFENRMKNLYDFEISIRKIEISLNKTSSFFCGQIGFSVSKERLINRDIYSEEYDSVFTLVEEEVEREIEDKSMLTLLPKGTYVCIRYNGVHKDAPKYYNVLLDYIKKNNYEILDDSVEIQHIDPNLTHNEKEYINEIQILVSKK